MKLIDLTGQRFGKLVVLHRVDRGNKARLSGFVNAIVATRALFVAQI